LKTVDPGAVGQNLGTYIIYLNKINTFVVNELRGRFSGLYRSITL